MFPIKKTIRCFVLVPFLFTLLTTFSVAENLAHGFTSGKYFWFYFSVGLVAVAGIYNTFCTQKKIKFNLSDGLILIFGITSLLVSIYLNNSEASSKHVILILVLLLYFYFRNLFQANTQAKWQLTGCFIFTGLVESVWGLRQLYGFEESQHNLFRITGSFFNPGPYACYVSTIMPAALFYAIKYRSCCQVKFHARKIALYLLWGLSTLTVVFSILVLPAAMSRASWLATVGGCGLALGLLNKNKLCIFFTRNKKKCLLAVFITTVLLIAGCIGMYQLKKDSADGRTFIWKNTIELIKQNPEGVGIGNFSGSYGHVQAAYFEAGNGTESKKRIAGNPEYAFNEYLQICAEQGVLVFLLFACIIGYSFFIGIKRKKTAPTASLFALSIAAFASYPFSILPFLIVLIFLLALIHTGEKGIVIPKPVAITFAFCGLTIVSLCLYNRYPTYDAYKKWHSLKMTYKYENQMKAATQYEALSPLLSDRVQFLFEYAQCLSKSAQYEKSNRILEKAVKISCDPMFYNIMGKNYQGLKKYDRAEQCFIKSSNIVPSRVYPHYLMALMYAEAGKTEKAKAAAQIVIEKDAKVQSTAIREMKIEIKQLLNEL